MSKENFKSDRNTNFNKLSTLKDILMDMEMEATYWKNGYLSILWNRPQRKQNVTDEERE